MKFLLFLIAFLITSDAGWANCEGDCSEGFGTQDFDDGSQYVGQWKEGLQHGFGTYKFADGSEYIGQWESGFIQGQGTTKYANGDTYVGQFQKDSMHGEGVYTYGPKSEFAGDIYEGAWKQGIEHGEGVYTYGPKSEAAGFIVNARWENGVIEGAGTYTSPDGKVYSGLWEDGILQPGEEASMVTEDAEDSTEESFDEVLAAAKAGDHEAQNSVGLMYDEGQGVTEDKEEALSWYRKSAAGGDEWGQYNLGLMFYLGEGVEENDVMAKIWFEKSAAQGNIEAQYRLGEIYEKGYGVKRSRKTAARWYKAPAEQGHEQAEKALLRIQQATAKAERKERFRDFIGRLGNAATQVANQLEEDRIRKNAIYNSSNSNHAPIGTSVNNCQLRKTLKGDFGKLFCVYNCIPGGEVVDTQNFGICPVTRSY